MKKIPLSNGGFTLVDEKHFRRLNAYKWAWKKSRQSRTKYVFRKVWTGSQTLSIYMHREIMGAKRGEKVDHEDHDGLNNQEVNLRKCTHQNNCCNQRKQVRPTSSRYKGVARVPPRVHKSKPWMAQIHHRGKRYSLGYFADEADAAITYNVAAQLFFGKFACLNDV